MNQKFDLIDHCRSGLYLKQTLSAGINRVKLVPISALFYMPMGSTNLKLTSSKADLSVSPRSIYSISRWSLVGQVSSWERDFLWGNPAFESISVLRPFFVQCPEPLDHDLLQGDAVV